MSVSPEEMNKNQARPSAVTRMAKSVAQLAGQDFRGRQSHKCPEYVLSTPPCQGSCPAGEDIRGYLNIVRGVEKPVGGVPMAGIRMAPPDLGQSVPFGDGPCLPGTLRIWL